MGIRRGIWYELKVYYCYRSSIKVDRTTLITHVGFDTFKGRGFKPKTLK